MKLSSRHTLVILALVSCLTLPVFAASKEKDAEKEKPRDIQSVDSGSFGIFMNGQRVGTETFSVDHTNSGSLISSEFKTVNAPTEAVQSSVMDLTVAGEIRRYEWKEVSPVRAHAVVTPNDEFLLEKWSAGPEDKEHDQPYVLAHNTTILDDYFFIHREILLWKFLAASCKGDNGALRCLLKQRGQFSTMNPHQHSSAPLSAESLGREKIAFKGAPHEFNKVEFKTESGSWLLWFDDQFKVVQMFVEGDNTQVIRD